MTIFDKTFSDVVYLNNQLEKVDSPFIVGKWAIPQEIEIPSIEFHKKMIAQIFDKKILPESRQFYKNSIKYYKQKIAENCSNSELKLFKKTLNYLENKKPFANVDVAKPKLLENSLITPFEKLENFESYKNLNQNNWFLELYHSFNEPPYGLTIEYSERKNLWQNFCDVIGLNIEDNIQVYDWIRYSSVYDFEPEYSPLWSDYFNSGLEWWGVWCLTIFNPKFRTVSVVLASATD